MQRRYPLAAIGRATTGIVDSTQGTIVQSTTIQGYDGTNWKEQIARVCPLPVHVENDSRAATWGEFCLAGYAEDATVSLITIGSGIGCGFILAGHLWGGASGASGEMGYMTVQADGPEYHGNVGCLEAYASAPGIVAYVQTHLQAGRTSKISDATALTFRCIAQLAEEQDELALEAVRYAAEMLGVGIVNLVHLFNPHAVILGGGVVEASPLYVQVATQIAMQRLLVASRVGLTITTAQLGNRAAIVGAGLLALKQRNRANAR